MKIVLEQPNPTKKIGLRDKFYIALLYDSGCRNQEILDLRLKDFVVRKNGEAEVHIVGKGNKYRVTPISKEVVNLFQKYCEVYHSNRNQEDYLFYTIRKDIVRPMSADNVARFLNTYEIIYGWSSFTTCIRMARTFANGNNTDLCQGNNRNETKSGRKSNVRFTL